MWRTIKSPLADARGSHDNRDFTGILRTATVREWTFDSFFNKLFIVPL